MKTAVVIHITTACGEVSFQHSWLFTGDNAGNLADNKFQQLWNPNTVTKERH